jgi:hypothetical protein
MKGIGTGRSAAKPAQADQVDQLISELAGEGVEESVGEFTLDRAKAREKMRQFQLADPYRYVLELVQAAVLKGATRIRFDIDADDMIMQFDGSRFTMKDFDHIYASLFSGHRKREVKARRELALGLNAAMALNPRRVTVVSGDGESGVELELRPDQPDRFQKAEKPVKGTVIHVKARFRPGLVVNFFKDRAGTLPEEQTLRRYCSMSQVPIDLEGNVISRGFQLKDAQGVVTLAGPELSGLVGFSPEQRFTSAVTWIKNGVRIATHEFKTRPAGLTAVVEAEALRKDVSQADIVQDDAYKKAMDQVRKAGRASLKKICKEVLASVESDAPCRVNFDWAMKLLSQALFGRVSLKPFRSDDPERLSSLLSRLPLFTTLNQERVDLQTIIKSFDDQDYVAFSRKGFEEHRGDVKLDPGVLAGDRLVLLLEEGREKGFLKRLFKKNLKSATKHLENRVKRELNHRRFLARHASPRLDSGFDRVEQHRPGYLVTLPIENQDVKGEMGIRRTDLRNSRLRLVKSGCVLCEQSLQLPVTDLDMVLEAEFTPNRMWNGVKHDALYARVIRAVVRNLHRLYGRLAAASLPGAPDAQWSRMGHLTRYLEASLKKDFVELFLKGAKVTKKQIGTDADELLKLGRPPLGVGQLPAAKGEEPHPLVTWAMFTAVDGGSLSLSDLEKEITAKGAFRWVNNKHPRDPSRHEPIAWLNKTERRIVAEIFGKGKMKNVGEKYKYAIAETQFLERPVEKARLPAFGDYVPSMGFEGGGIEGELAFSLNRPPAPDQSVSIRILKQMRHLGGRALKLGLPEGRAVVNSDTLTATDDWTNVNTDGELQRVRMVVRRAGLVLLGHLAENHARLRTEVRLEVLQLLRSALEALFPHKVFGRIYRMMNEEARGIGDPEVQFAEVMDLLAWVDREVLAKCLDRFNARDEVPDADRLQSITSPRTIALDAVPEFQVRLNRAVALFASPPEPSAGWDGLQQAGRKDRVLLPKLFEVPLFTSMTRQPVTLKQLFEMVRSDEGPIYYLDSVSSAEPLEDKLVLMVNSEDVDLLRRIFGNAALDHAGPLLEQARAYKRFVAQEAESEIHLEGRKALVSVPIEAEGITGEVGLTVYPSLNSWMSVHREHRWICTIYNFAPEGLTAAVNDDWLTPNPDFTGIVKDAEFDRVTEACRAALPSLMGKLAAHWSQLAETDRHVAFRHVLGYLAEQVPGYCGRSELLDDQLERELAALEGFVGADGKLYSLADLGAAYLCYGEVAYLPGKREGSPLDPSRCVIFADAGLLRALRTLFEQVHDYTVRWDDEQVVVRLRRQSRRQVPDPDTVPSLVRSECEIESCKGKLLLPLDPEHGLSVSLSGFGYEVRRVEASDLFPCAGVLDVPAHELRKGDPAVLELTADQKEDLEKQAYELYRKLARKYRKRGPDSDEATRTAYGYLRSALLKLYALKLDAENGGDAARFQKFRPHYNELEFLPLFELADGKRINLRKALKMRPAELEDALPSRSKKVEVQPEQTVAVAPPSPLPSPTPPQVLEEPATGEERPAAVEEAEPEVPPAAVAAEPEGEVLDAPVEEQEKEEAEQLADLPEEVQEIVTRAVAEERLAQAVTEFLERVLPPGDQLTEHIRLCGLHVSDERGSGACANCVAEGVVLYRDHPLVAAALEGWEKDPVLISMVGSAVYTAVNIYLKEVTDDDENAFHHLLAGHLLGLDAVDMPQTTSN